MTPLPPLYKFLTADMRSPSGTGGWRTGRWRSVRGVLVPCTRGLHATTADNLLPYLDAQLWRVEVGEEYLWHDSYQLGRKLVARRMRPVERIATWNERTARLFAADCAERVLPLFEAERPGDDRPRRAIEVARRFASGEATREELAAARTAAGVAVRTAGVAVRTAGVAAWAAAWDAEGAATTAAVRVAARVAVRVAARTAVRVAARTDDRPWQARHLAELLGLPVAVERVDADA